MEILLHGSDLSVVNNITQERPKSPKWRDLKGKLAKQKSSNY